MTCPFSTVENVIVALVLRVNVSVKEDAWNFARSAALAWWSRGCRNEPWPGDWVMDAAFFLPTITPSTFKTPIPARRLACSLCRRLCILLQGFPPKTVWCCNPQTLRLEFDLALGWWPIPEPIFPMLMKASGRRGEPPNTQRCCVVFFYGVISTSSKLLTLLDSQEFAKSGKQSKNELQNNMFYTNAIGLVFVHNNWFIVLHMYNW